MQNNTKNINTILNENVEEDVEEVQEGAIQPVKRGRGRPRKNPTEPVVEQVKRKRGRPKKVVEEPEQPEYDEEIETTLPGFENMEEETALPGFENREEEEETTLPGFEGEEKIELPTLEDSDVDDEYTNVLNNLRIENELEEKSNNQLIKLYHLLEQAKMELHS